MVISKEDFENDKQTSINPFLWGFGAFLNFNRLIIFRCATFVTQIRQNSNVHGRATRRSVMINNNTSHVNTDMHATGSYLIVGVALWIEGGERRDRCFIQPLALLVRPRLLIRGNLGRFYLRCTNNAQHSMTEHTHTPTRILVVL